MTDRDFFVVKPPLLFAFTRVKETSRSFVG